MVAELRDTRAGYVTNVDTRWIKDGSFIRGRNLLLGYNLPLSAVRKMRLERFRMYESAKNFLLISHKDLNGDPESNPKG